MIEDPKGEVNPVFYAAYLGMIEAHGDNAVAWCKKEEEARVEKGADIAAWWFRRMGEFIRERGG